MTNTFQHDYTVLGLEKDADWSTTQVRYRQQVHEWHPDRFARRPREAVHAQQKFIELTTAYRNLRQYHKLNSTMPFEPSSNIENRHKRAPVLKKRAGSQSAIPLKKPPHISNSDVQSESLLNRSGRNSRASLNKIELSSQWRWAVPVALLLVGTVGLFIYTDKRQTQQVVERSKVEQTQSNQ